MSELETYFNWKHLNFDITIEQCIKHKFPQIKNLNVECGQITFENDGLHTRAMIEEFMKQFQK